VRSGGLGDAVTALTPRLTKGTQVYCEGRLNLGTWTGGNAEARTGLNLAVWEVQPMRQIGRRKPKVRPRDEQGAVPLDDELRFDMGTAELRKLWRRYFEEGRRVSRIWARRGYEYPPPESPAFPEELRASPAGQRPEPGHRANVGTFGYRGTADCTR
jgi:hypothetical protein